MVWRPGRTIIKRLNLLKQKYRYATFPPKNEKIWFSAAQNGVGSTFLGVREPSVTPMGVSGEGGLGTPKTGLGDLKTHYFRKEPGYVSNFLHTGSQDSIFSWGKRPGADSTVDFRYWISCEGEAFLPSTPYGCPKKCHEKKNSPHFEKL